MTKEDDKKYNRVDPSRLLNNNSTVTMWKKRGETPLVAIERLRAELKLSNEVPMSYAGRLDPMAEGLLLVLIGDENKNREKYLGLDKVYEVDIIFGVKTDTGDVMGLVKEKVDSTDNISYGSTSDVDIFDTDLFENKLKDILSSCIGEHNQLYPAFSSKPVEGKPLFQWAKEGIFPKAFKKINIISAKLMSCAVITAVEFQELIESDYEVMKNVAGDFRQEEIIAGWKSFFNKINTDKGKKFRSARMQVECSSGTYMRSIVESIGDMLGTEAIALKIIRIKIGNN